MAIWRTSKREAHRPRPQLSICRNCPEEASCPHSNHYTRDGRCSRTGHNCKEFRPKDWKPTDHEIRQRNRQRSFGSRHERLTLTDVERCMARGESDVVELDFQVPFPLGLRAGGHSVYIADALAQLKPGGRFARRIYEPKGIKTPIYLLKRKLVQLMYPDVEFVEVNQ